MSPFTTKMTRSNLRESLLLVLIPLAILVIVLFIYFQDNPNSTFTHYQEAVAEKNWVKAIDLSDEITRAYLSSLNQWIWSGSIADIEAFEPFQQFLILTSRCQVLGEGGARPTETELFAIWMRALRANQIIVRSKVVNRYNFGEKSIGQLFIEQTHASTGLKIRFIKESRWSIESISLLKEVYQQTALNGVGELLRAANPDYFEKEFSSQHLLPLKFQIDKSPGG